MPYDYLDCPRCGEKIKSYRNPFPTVDIIIEEALEETSLAISNLRLVGCYSDPARDQRLHAISTVYAASGAGEPRAADDAASLAIFSLSALPEKLCFDHGKILADYARLKSRGLI